MIKKEYKDLFSILIDISQLNRDEINIDITGDSYYVVHNNIMYFILRNNTFIIKDFNPFYESCISYLRSTHMLYSAIDVWTGAINFSFTEEFKKFAKMKVFI